MYLNLNLSPSVKVIKKILMLDLEFIHIDLSQGQKDATDEEIVDATRQSCGICKDRQERWSSEPHYFGGSSNVHKEEIDYEDD